MTDSIQRLQRIAYQGLSRRIWRLENSRKVIRTVTAADDLALLAKEGAVLQGMIERLK